MTVLSPAIAVAFALPAVLAPVGSSIGEAAAESQAIVIADLIPVPRPNPSRQSDDPIGALIGGPDSTGSVPDKSESAAQTASAIAPPPLPRTGVARTASSESAAAESILDNGADPAEAAYDAGYQLWNSGKYDAAIKSLQAFTKKYPDHRRTSWAYNLAGRALLDKGQPRAAAEALLANYRRDPKGERAQDSLFYLGQALMRPGQPGQACKAYAELEEVYSGNLRAPLKSALAGAKSEAKCS